VAMPVKPSPDKSASHKDKNLGGNAGKTLAR
jgi:hypothetical protein